MTTPAKTKYKLVANRKIIFSLRTSRKSSLRSSRTLDRTYSRLPHRPRRPRGRRPTSPSLHPRPDVSCSVCKSFSQRSVLPSNAARQPGPEMKSNLKTLRLLFVTPEGRDGRRVDLNPRCCALRRSHTHLFKPTRTAGSNRLSPGPNQIIPTGKTAGPLHLSFY